MYIICMYYIYHIPGVKIGCTKDLLKRMADQGFTEWEILEEHTDGWLAGDREIELQKQYSYPVDKIHYMQSLKNRPSWDKTGNQSERGKLGVGIKKPGVVEYNKTKRLFTFFNVKEIKDKYIPRKYTMKMLAKEYNVSYSVINKIINNNYNLN